MSRLSGESRNDGLFGEAAASSNGGAASAGEVVAVGVSDAFDDAELAQTGELSREGGGRALGEQRSEVGAAQAGDVEAGTLQGREQAPLARVCARCQSSMRRKALSARVKPIPAVVSWRASQLCPLQ